MCRVVLKRLPSYLQYSECIYIKIKFETCSILLVPNKLESILSVQGEWSVLTLSCKLPEPLKLTEISSV